jgi:hypothetical protein
LRFKIYEKLGLLTLKTLPYWAVCVYLLVNCWVLYQISGKSQQKLATKRHKKHKGINHGLTQIDADYFLATEIAEDTGIILTTDFID